MAGFQTQVPVDPPTGLEDRDTADAAAAREAEAWKIAQLAAVISSGTVKAGVNAASPEAAVNMARIILTMARERVPKA